jgi:hypothetical protein
MISDGASYFQGVFATRKNVPPSSRSSLMADLQMTRIGVLHLSKYGEYSSIGWEEVSGSGEEALLAGVMSAILE